MGNLGTLAPRLLLWAALAASLSACGGSDESIDFANGSDPTKPAPRNRPYPCPPDTAPMPESMCTVPDLSCEYRQGTCKCGPDPMGTFGALAWSCTFSAPSETCPASQPEAGTACTSLLDAAACSYGLQVACHCSGETQTWACWDPADCSKGQPDDKAECDPVGMACPYPPSSCECFSSGWSCTKAP